MQPLGPLAAGPLHARAPARSRRSAHATDRSEDDFTSRLRSPAVAARVGLWLGICFGICFLTGLVSHYAQHAVPADPVPDQPRSWGYRLTQGLHVITGTAAIPLLLVKLWSVFPQLFQRARHWPSVGDRSSVTLLERGSIARRSSPPAIFQLATGLANAAQWYPWSVLLPHRPTTPWPGSRSARCVVHIAVKLPVIRDVAGARHRRHHATTGPRPPSAGALSRRALLRTTWAAAGVAVLATAGSTVPAAAQGLGASRSAPARAPGRADQQVGRGRRGSTESARRRLDASRSSSAAHVDRSLSATTCARCPQHTVDLPIACVEGWSAQGTWSGVRLRDLLDARRRAARHDVRVVSLQPSRRLTASPCCQGNFADDDRTLLALDLSGEPLPSTTATPAG